MHLPSIRAAAAVAALALAPCAQAALQVITNPNQLDFSGNFVYAASFGGGGGAQVGNAVFTSVASNGSGAPAGLTVSGFNVDTPWGGASNLGATADANGLEAVMSTIIWSSGLNPGNIDLAVTTGTTYRLQLLFSEGCCNNRHFDVNVESGLLTQEIVGTAFNANNTWTASATQGYALTLDFTAADASLNINFLRHAPGDTNYHISGLTLERLATVPEPTGLALAAAALLGAGVARRRRAVRG
ncbi:MAG: hypothetical protein RJA10_3153 [Pseudomonadota bacterium]|jgi:hypothetical protein